jgi:hypothetical protein
MMGWLELGSTKEGERGRKYGRRVSEMKSHGRSERHFIMATKVINK